MFLGHQLHQSIIGSHGCILAIALTHSFISYHTHTNTILQLCVAQVTPQVQK